MLLKLLALFVLVPLIELALLLLLAAKTSVLLTLVVVVATGIAGTILARSQGWKTFRRIQTDMSQGKLPTDALLDAAMIFCAGALLLTPGLLTDVLGLSLLIPFCRHWYRQRLLRWIRRNFPNSRVRDNLVQKSGPRSSIRTLSIVRPSSNLHPTTTTAREMLKL